LAQGFKHLVWALLDLGGANPKMTCAHGAAAAVAEACVGARVMLSTTVVGSVTAPQGQRVLVAEPCYTAATPVPGPGHMRSVDGVAAGPCLPDGGPARAVHMISGSLASTRPVLQLPQEFQLGHARLRSSSTDMAAQGGLAARRGFRPPPGLSAVADKESEDSRADSDGCSTTDTSRIPSPTGGDGSAGSRLAASCPGSPGGRLAPEAGGVPVLRLESALPPRGPLSSPEVPSEGSRWHHLGTCKPCAFVFKGGCSNGVACSFCHLCPPGEKKMRKQARKAV